MVAELFHVVAKVRYRMSHVICSHPTATILLDSTQVAGCIEDVMIVADAESILVVGFDEPSRGRYFSVVLPLLNCGGNAIHEQHKAYEANTPYPKLFPPIARR